MMISLSSCSRRSIRLAYPERPVENFLWPVFGVRLRILETRIPKLLIQKGADVNFGPSGQGTPLYYRAAEGRNYDMVKFLLNEGPDVNIRCYYSLDPDTAIAAAVTTSFVRPR